jgi:hypothetical protein
MNREVLAAVAALAMISGSGEPRTRSGNRPITEFHFDAVRGGMPFFPATVNAIGPFQFLLDTGGSGGHLDGEIAKRLGLRLERGTASVSGSANLEVGIIREATLAVGAARHRGQLLVSPLAPIEPILGRPFEGIIGSDFLQRYVLELNYDARVCGFIRRPPFTTRVAASRSDCRSRRAFRSSDWRCHWPTARRSMATF